MVFSMMKPQSGSFSYAEKCLCSGLHMTQECRDTKLWPVSGCITISLYLEGQSQ
jgi:hypothetical protein